MCIEGNPNLCPQQSICVDTQTSEVSEGEEEPSSSQTSCEDRKEEEDVDPFFTWFGEMSDKAFHNMMSVNYLTYSTLFCDKLFDNELLSSHANLESCKVMGDNERHGKENPETSIQSARERGYFYYESSSDEDGDEDDELYTNRSNYSNSGHFRNFAFDANSLTDFIYCTDGFKSYLEEFYDDSESDNDYFLADEGLEESQNVSCQSFPNGAQGVVGSKKSTLSCHAIRHSGKRRSFGEDSNAMYMSNSKSSVSDLTVSNVAGQSKVDEVESL